MVRRMIFQNVIHRPIRTMVSVLGIAVEVGMVMLVVGLTHGMLRASAKRIGGLGADVMVEPPNASIFMGLTSAPMPIKLGDYFGRLEHVRAVTPVIFQFTTAGARLIWGIDPKSWNRVTGGFVYLQGGALAAPYDILVDNYYARQDHIKVGQTLNLLNHDFRVVGIVEHGKGSRLFIPIETAEHLAGQRARASVFFIKCTNPGYTADVVSEIKKLASNYAVFSVRNYMSLLTSNDLPALNDFIMVIIGIAVIIGFLVIFLSMYTTVGERTREIGILKSLGATQAYIIGLILLEAGALSIAGIIVGYGGTWAGWKLIEDVFPTLTVELTLRWAAWAALLALGGALLGSFYPALHAARLDPVDALAYE